MKKSRRIKKILLPIIAVIVLTVLVGYFGFYARVYNQSNVKQNTEMGSNIHDLTLEKTVNDLVNFPNRFAGTKSNAEAGQYIRNYFREAGLTPYMEDENSYYHSFRGKWLKNSAYYEISVNGTVENVAGKIIGKDSTKAIVISAHFDSFMSKGVLDNATGVSVLLELSKRLASQFPAGSYPVDIVFVSFNAEESGLEGSRPFYDDISKRYDELYNINMDVVGAVDKPLAYNNQDANSSMLYADFLPILQEFEIPVDEVAIYAADIYNKPLGNSDHVSFQEKGHAAIILGESKLQGYTNTELDKEITAVDFPELNRLADAVEKFILTTNGKMYWWEYLKLNTKNSSILF